MGSLVQLEVWPMAMAMEDVAVEGRPSSCVLRLASAAGSSL